MAEHGIFVVAVRHDLWQVGIYKLDGRFLDEARSSFVMLSALPPGQELRKETRLPLPFTQYINTDPLFKKPHLPNAQSSLA